MKTRSKLPNFLFVGTAKAGTTSIHNYLSQHPEISIPVKETFFFIRSLFPKELLEYPKQRVEETIVRTLDEYENIYCESTKQFIGEIGTGYLHEYEVAIPEIKKVLGTDVKICIILRDPVERTYSGYMHFKRFSIELLDLLSEIENEPQRKEDGFDFMWQFSGMSFYARSIEAYLSNFKNVKVFLYEDLVSDPSGSMKDLFDYIGVDPNYQIDTSKIFNPSGNPKNRTIQKIVTQDNFLKRILRPIYHKIFGKENVERLRDTIRDANVRKEGLDERTRHRLRSLFEKDIQKVSELLGRDLNIKEKWQ